MPGHSGPAIVREREEMVRVAAARRELARLQTFFDEAHTLHTNV
jgi:hypothetical protein